MHSLQIRELPTAVYQWLGQKAEREHRSLTQQAIAELHQAMQPDVRSVRRLQTLAKLRSLGAPSNSRDLTALEPWQREDRER